MLSLQDLEEALPALLDIRSAEPRRIDWEFIRREIGALPPADFIALAESYPSFSMDDFLGLHIPSPGEEQYFVSGIRSILEDLENLECAGMTRNHSPFPAPGGLLPWGSSSEGDNLYWQTQGNDPDLWTVVVSGRNDDWFHYEGDLTSYLAAKVRGTLPPDGLRPDFPGLMPVIEAD